jgi:O-antigen/teichoic acid export membrane protein
MRRVIELLRRPTVFLAVGLIVSAFSGSVYLLILNLTLSSQGFLQLSGLNILWAAISTGVMSGIEQEMVRAVSRAIAHRLPTAPVIRRQLRQAVWFTGVMLVGCLALSPVITANWLHGSWVVFAELMLGLAGAVVSFQVRGTLSGKQDFHVFSITLLVEAFTRLLPCLVLLWMDNHDTWLYGLWFALGPVASAAVGIWLPKVWHRPQFEQLEHYEPDQATDADAGSDSDSAADSDPDSAPSEENSAKEETGRRAASNLGLLTGATLASQLLLNVVPLLVIARYQNVTGNEVNLAAAINSAVGLARLGIVALLPIQTPLLPKLTTAAERGEVSEVRRMTLLLVAICAGLGLAAVVVCATAGPWVMRDIMHAHGVLPNWFLAAFSAATMFIMVAFILQAGLIAMNRHKSVMLGWGLGVAVTIPIFALSSGNSSILDVTAAGALAGPLVTALFLAADLWWSMHHHAPANRTPDPDPDPTGTAATAAEEALR